MLYIGNEEENLGRRGRQSSAAIGLLFSSLPCSLVPAPLVLYTIAIDITQKRGIMGKRNETIRCSATALLLYEAFLG
jgi:hypothetical protein